MYDFKMYDLSRGIEEDISWGAGGSSDGRMVYIEGFFVSNQQSDISRNKLAQCEL